jgi:two-component system response regulator YesN
MKLGDNETILSIINNLFGRFYIGKKYNIEYVQSLCIEFLFGALRVAYEFGDDFSDVGLSLTGIIKNVLEFNNISNLQQYMTSVFTEIAKRYSLKYNSNKSNTISRIKEIVNKKYFDNFSLQTIADEVHFTPSYISMIFKQETGTNLIEYITKFRVEKAKELLTNSGIRVSEVAKMVGFDNPHYFSTVYKKYTGLRPNEFRGE